MTSLGAGRAIGFAARLTAAALLSLFLAQALELRLPLWVVLTAIIVSQTNLGRSLKVALDYFIGTALGAIWGGVLVAFIPQSQEAFIVLTLGLAIAPLGVIAALDPRFTAAPLTAAIIVLGLKMTHLTPVSAVVERVMEVGVGGFVGLVVSFVFLPASAFHLVRERAADVLARMSNTAEALIEGAEEGLAAKTVQQHHARLGELLTTLSGAVAEADRERVVRIGKEDGAPLFRSLLRLRHDLIIIGRAVENPLPDDVAQSLLRVYRNAGHVLHEHFAECALAMRSRKPGPVTATVDAAIETCGKELEDIRRANVLRGLSGDELEHVFAMSFALEQMRRNLADLKLRIDEWAR